MLAQQGQRQLLMPQVLLTMLGSCCGAWATQHWGGAGAGAVSQPAHGPLYRLQLPTAAGCIDIGCLQAGCRAGQNIELSCLGERSFNAAL